MFHPVIVVTDGLNIEVLCPTLTPALSYSEQMAYLAWHLEMDK